MSSFLWGLKRKECRTCTAEADQGRLPDPVEVGAEGLCLRLCSCPLYLAYDGGDGLGVTFFQCSGRRGGLNVGCVSIAFTFSLCTCDIPSLLL